MSEREVCVFELAGQAFAAAAFTVREVVRVDRIKRVPRAHACIVGLFNLRGQIVPAIDLRRRLELPAGKATTLIVSEFDGELVGFLVDSVRDVLTLAGDALESVPSTVPDSVRQVVTGALPVADGWLLCIDLAMAARLPDLTPVGAGEWTAGVGAASYRD
jgi:purine-binding chemotaxis protein CheW